MFRRCVTLRQFLLAEEFVCEDLVALFAPRGVRWSLKVGANPRNEVDGTVVVTESAVVTADKDAPRELPCLSALRSFGRECVADRHKIVRL